MIIQLNHLILPDGLNWSDQFNVVVSQNMRRRLDGGLVIYSRALTGGRPITLVATADHWLTWAQALALQIMAEDVGAVFDLSIRGDSFSVMFRHQDAPALELQKLIDFSEPTASDPVIGEIKLIAL